MEGGDELWNVGRLQRDDVAGSDATSGQRPGEEVDLVLQRSIADLAPSLALDEGSALGVFRRQRAEQQLVDADVGDRDRCVGAWDGDNGELLIRDM